MAQEYMDKAGMFEDWLEEDFERFQSEDEDNLIELPVLALRDAVMYPHMMIPLLVGRNSSLSAVEAAMDGGRRMVALAQREQDVEEMQEKQRQNYIMSRGEDKPETTTVKRDQEKIGRNDPCPCGSGKKYKKCCGK